MLVVMTSGEVGTPEEVVLVGSCKEGPRGSGATSFSSGSSGTVSIVGMRSNPFMNRKRRGMKEERTGG